MGTATRFVLLVGLVVGCSGCAFIRLYGCRKLAACGQLVAYDCNADLVCADANGQTLRSEPLSSVKDACHICPSRRE